MRERIVLYLKDRGPVSIDPSEWEIISYKELSDIAKKARYSCTVRYNPEKGQFIVTLLRLRDKDGNELIEHHAGVDTISTILYPTPRHVHESNERTEHESTWWRGTEDKLMRSYILLSSADVAQAITVLCHEMKLDYTWVREFIHSLPIEEI